MLGMSLGNLFVRIGADTSGLKDGRDQAVAFLNDMDAKFTQVAKVAGAMALAAGAAAATIASAMVKSSMDSAREITNLATVSGTGTEEFRKLAYAAKTVGIEQEKLADIFKDVRDRVGDFLITGGGPMLDFFEQIAPKVGVTAEMFRGLSGPDALLLFKDSLDKANVSAEEQVFFMEAMASDLTNLLPLLANGGEGLRFLGEQAQKAGAVLSDIETEQIRQASVAIQQITGHVSAFADQLTAKLAPYLQAIAKYISEASRETGGFSSAIDTGISWAIRIVGALMDEWHRTKATILTLKMVWEQSMASMGSAWAALVEGVMKGVAAIRGAWNSVATVFGKDPIPPYSEGMAKFVEQAKTAAKESAAAVATTKSELAKLLAQPLPSEGLDEWLAAARKASEEAAKAAIDARKKIMDGDGKPGAGTGGKDDKGGAAAQVADDMARRLEALRQALMTEEEAERASYQTRMNDLRQFYEAGLITKAEYDEMEARAHEEHQNRMLEITRRRIQEEQQMKYQLMGSLSSTLSSISSLLNSFGEKNLAASKAFGVASIAVSTAVGIMKAMELPFPLNWAQAAAVAAQGIAQAAAVMSSSKGSTGSMKGVAQGGSSGGAADAGPRTQQMVSINLQGDVYSRQSVVALITQINDAVADGAKIMVN